MGFSSYNCKHCDHAILSQGATDKGINEWMVHAVILAKNGSRLIVDFDGYSGHVEEDSSFSYGGTVWVHQACWEIAGKPEFDAYDGASRSAEDQGWFFEDGTHDLIDPRITDEDERACLLAKGVERRTQIRYDQRARTVSDLLDPNEAECRDEGTPVWHERFTLHNGFLRDEAGEIIREEGGHMALHDETKWEIGDVLNPNEDLMFQGTEKECHAHLNGLWAQFFDSDECAAYLARHEEVCQAARAEELEQFKKEGRYQTSYRSRQVPDEEGVQKYLTLYYVNDMMTFAHVENEDCFTGDGAAKKAKAEAQRLNEEWAVAGYPEEDVQDAP